MKKISLLTIIIASLSMISWEMLACDTCGCQAPKAAAQKVEVKYITKADVQKKVKDNKDLVIIDVLSPKSYAAAHIKGAINIPLNKLHNDDILKSLDKNKTYIVYCASKQCKASTKAAKLLLDHGFKNVLDYENGIAEWKAEKLPTETAELCKCGMAKGSPACCK